MNINVMGIIAAASGTFYLYPEFAKSRRFPLRRSKESSKDERELPPIFLTLASLGNLDDVHRIGCRGDTRGRLGVLVVLGHLR